MPLHIEIFDGRPEEGRLRLSCTVEDGTTHQWLAHWIHLMCERTWAGSYTTLSRRIVEALRVVEKGQGAEAWRRELDGGDYIRVSFINHQEGRAHVTED